MAIIDDEVQSNYVDNYKIDKCKENIPEAKILRDNAFNSTEINIADGWDLVITNPPSG